MPLARGALAALAFAALAASGCSSLPADGTARGEALYKYCVTCHGENGEGNTLVNAPRIAGLPAWYIEAQVLHFQNGARGAHEADVEGLKMRPMARNLKSDQDVAVVAAYVASLPKAKGPATVKGDVEKGKAAFATCTACHGADGAGNEQLKAPPIRQLDDWYVATQLGKFKSGVRGYDARDTQGQQMGGIAKGIADEAAMNDLAAYIQTLPMN